MSVERGVLFMAGLMVLISLALAQWVTHYWLLLTLFAGLNLFQSSLTGWCPAEYILNALGFSGNTGKACSVKTPKMPS